MENIDKIREQFPITKNKVFLNHAAMSPLPKPVADAVRKCVDDFSNFGTTSIELNDDGKPFFAKLIGAKPEEIALVENTSVGLNIAANDCIILEVQKSSPQTWSIPRWFILGCVRSWV